MVEPFPARIKAKLVNFLSQQYISGNNFSYLATSHFYYINVQILEEFELILFRIITIKIQGIIFTDEFDRAK